MKRNELKYAYNIYLEPTNFIITTLNSSNKKYISNMLKRSNWNLSNSIEDYLDAKHDFIIICFELNPLLKKHDFYCNNEYNEITLKHNIELCYKFYKKENNGKYSHIVSYPLYGKDKNGKWMKLYGYDNDNTNSIISIRTNYKLVPMKLRSNHTIQIVKQSIYNGVYSCIICLDSISNVKLKSCGHIPFCYPCYQRFLLEKKDNLLCPICRCNIL